MRVPGTRRARLIILLSLAALAALIGWLLFVRARALYRNIGPLVVAELERQLGREVTIGRVDTSHPGRVVLDRVAVAAEQRLSGGTLFRARRITLSYSLNDLIWFRSDVAGSIRRVVVEQPFLMVVRDRNGQLNLLKLFKPRPPGAPPTRFRAQVVITGGQLLFRDYKAALPRLPAENEVGAVNGIIDYGAYPRITASASGVGRHGRADAIQTTTFIDTDGRWLLRAYVANADAAYWAAYATRTPAVRVQSGRANLDLVVSRTGAKAPLEYVANLGAAGLSARIARLPAPIRSVRGVAQVTPYGVKLDASGDLAGMPIQVNGNILDWKQPQVALSVRGGGITLAAARQVMPQIPAVPGLSMATPGQVNAWILGPASRLYATGSLTVPAADWRGEKIRDARAEWRFHAGMVQFDRLTATTARGGRLAATGWAQVQPGPPQLYATGRLENINLAGLPGVSPRTRLGGRADARFAVSGTPRDLHGGAWVQLSHLIWNTARLEAATARLDYQNGVLYVRSLRAADQRGQLVAAGTVTQRGKLNLQVRARGIDLAAVLAPFSKQPASGIAYLVGIVGGTVRDPQLVGHLQVYAGRLGPLNTDYAEGPVVLRPDRVETQQLVLRIYPGQVTLKGSAGGWREGRPRVDMTAAVQDMSVARLLAMAKMRLRAVGSLSGNLTFVGDPTRLAAATAPGRPSSPAPWRATGTLRVEDLLVEGARLGTATARLDTEQGRLWVREAAIDGEALAATAHGSVGLIGASPRTGTSGAGASGWVTKDSPLDFAFAVQRLDLARVASRAGARVLLQGSAQVTDGVVKGSVGAPVVTAQAGAAPIVVNGVSFDRLAGQATYTPSRVSLQNVTLSEGGGAIRVSEASMRPEPGKPTNALSVDASVETFSLQRLIDIARNSASVGGRSPGVAPRAAVAQDVHGTVSGTITARPEGMQVGAPTLWTAALNAPTVTLPGYRLAPATGPATPDKTVPLSVGLKARATYSTLGRVVLESLEITRDDGLLLARGSMVQEGGRDEAGKEQPRGLLKLRVDATYIQMGLFGPLAPALHPLSGIGELRLDAEGPLRTPTIKGSMDIDKPTVAGVPFSHFYVPFLSLEAPPEGGLGSIQVREARLEVVDQPKTPEKHLLLVDGQLPFRWDSGGPGLAIRGRVPTDQPLSLSVRLPQQGLGVLTTVAQVDPQAVNPRVAPVLAALRGLTNLSGQMSADLTVTGTRARPNTQGSFQIADGAFQPQRGQTRFQQIGVQLGFTGNRIVVQQFQGRSSDGGRFEGSGEITGLALGVGDQAPAAAISLALSLQDLRYTERNLSAFFQERFRGTLRTVDRNRPDRPAPIRLEGNWKAPRLTGALEVRNTRLELPGTLPEARPRNAVFFANPTFNLDILLGKDVWLESARMRMQMAGKLPIRGTLASPVIRGTLIVNRGQLIFPTARFRVEGAVEVAFAPGAAEAPVPLRVDLTATARLRGTDPTTRQRQRYEVTMQIRGPLTADAFEAAGTLPNPDRPSSERLTIETRSDPPLSQQQVLALLGRQSSVEAVIRGGGDATKALQQEIADTVIGGFAAPAVFTPLETAIEDWLGLEEFSIDFALREPVQVRLTRQVYGPFFATYTRSLSAFGGAGYSTTTGGTALVPNLYTFELYYRISDRFRVGYRIEEPSENKVLQLNGTFRF